MPNYGQNPYLRSQGPYKGPRQVYRRGGGKKRRYGYGPNPMGLILAAVAVISVAVVAIILIPKGNPGGPGGGATTAPVLAASTPGDTGALQPTGDAAQTDSAAPAETPSAAPPSTASAPPAADLSAGFTADGSVQVDYDNMIYKSGDLYVKVTNVNENGINYYVADCQAKDSNRFFTALATDQYPVKNEEYATDMAKRKGAVIAINGDYFASGDSGSSDTTHRNGKGVVIRNGQLYRKTPWYDIAAIFKDGTMRTYNKSDINADALITNGCWQAWNFGPMLMDNNGKALPESQIKARPPKYNPANPRTGIGYIEPNHFVLIVVDGIRNGINEGLSKGLSTSDFAKLFESQGCKCAYNLDGGGSSVMVFMGKVISHPCDSGPDNQRAMSDIIYFGENETDQANIDRMNNR